MLRTMTIFFLLIGAADAAQARTWTDHTGKYTIEAEFVSLQDGQVHLQKPDGSVIAVPLERLSEADRRHVQSLSAKPSEATKTTPKSESGHTKVGTPRRATERTGTSQVKFGREAIDRALSQRVDAPRGETPLRDWVRQLADQQQIVICLDSKALDDAGIAADAPVASGGQGTTLEEVLNRCLKPQGLTWSIYVDLLVITTPAEAESHLEVGVYKLLRPAGLEALLEDIGSKIAAQSWNEVGGPGCRVGWPGAVVITQTPVVHRQIAAQYGNVLRRMFSAEGRRAGRANSQLGAKFAVPVACEFLETPLEQVAADLSKQSSVTVMLDSQAMAKVGVALNTPITLALRGVSLESTLSWMLRSLGLTWIPDGAALKVTTPEAAEAALQTTTYDVRDLVLAAGGNASLLVDTITGTLGPATWRTVGGPGVITPTPGGLQIQQTYHMHRAIERLLADLRQSMRG